MKNVDRQKKGRKRIRDKRGKDIGVEEMKGHNKLSVKSCICWEPALMERKTGTVQPLWSLLLCTSMHSENTVQRAT